jgi:hypothetical protein
MGAEDGRELMVGYADGKEDGIDDGTSDGTYNIHR